MKYAKYLGVLACLGGVAINVPFALQGSVINIVAGVFCLLCSVGCYWMVKDI